MSTVSGLEIANRVEAEWRDRLEAAVKAERASMIQLFTDPENQPSQFGTVLMKEWQCLTDEEVMNFYLFWVVDLQDIIGFYKAVERKLKERNT